MKRKEAAVRLVVLAASGLALVYLGWSALAPSFVQSCDACGRPLHPQTKTVALVDNRREVFCCPACALATRQTGKVVEISQLSDYETGKPLAPRDAYVVAGSAVNLCVHRSALMGVDKRVIPLVSDRCSPSVIAFAREEGAERLRQEQGGTFRRLEDLAAPQR